MSYIAIPTVNNTAPVISRFGNDDTYVELSFRHVGDETVELVSTKVEHTASGLPLRSEIGREIISEEDAGSVACDMEWDASKLLAQDGIDGYSDPVDFETAVELELAATSKEPRDSYMARAIKHNAALIAAE
jgi:hypothetical protein